MKSLASKKRNLGRIAMFCVMMLAMTVFMSMGVFASTSDYVAIQSSDLEPILEGAKANIGVILPVAIGLFAIVLGVGFAPTIIKKFRQ